MMKLRELFSKSALDAIKLLKSALLPMIILHLPYSLLEQFIYANATDDDSKLTLGIVGVLAAFVESIFSFLILSYFVGNIYSKTFTKHLKQNFSPLVIESFRGFSYVMVGFLKLIVPGIKRLIDFVFIPYIVIFDSNYSKGEVDVIVEIQKLTHGRVLKIMGTLFLTQLVIFGIDFTGLSYNVFTSPEIWIFIFFLEVVASVYIFNFIYNLYLNLKGN